jgi:hypothetical protein
MLELPEPYIQLVMVVERVSAVLIEEKDPPLGRALIASYKPPANCREVLMKLGHTTPLAEFVRDKRNRPFVDSLLEEHADVVERLYVEYVPPPSQYAEAAAA